MEHALFRDFEEARRVSKAIGCRQFKRYTRALYCQQYLARVSQDPNSGRLTYEGFKFSNGWFQGFRQRFGVTNRCRTKTAQKLLEDFQEKVVSQMQFNRQQTVILPSSDVGLPCGEHVPLVGRFKLSEIGNIDQTPLAFDFLSTRTYDAKGLKTIQVKESRSSWDKRKATLQVCVYANSVNRCKLLLIFIRAVVGDSQREKEERRYAKDVEVVWNPKAWANEDTMLAQLRGQWRGSSWYSTISPTKEP